MKILLLYLTSFSLVMACNKPLQRSPSKETLNNSYIENNYVESPLMLAAKAGNVPLMKTLIAQGADVNASVYADFPKAGYPVLRYAVDSASVEAVTVLLDAGASVHVLTLSSIQDENTKDSTMSKLLVRNLSILSHAVRMCAPISIIEILMAYGANVDGEPTHVSTMSSLMVAAYVGNFDAVVCLLKAGANAALIDNYGRTALDYARLQNHDAIIALLA